MGNSACHAFALLTVECCAEQPNTAGAGCSAKFDAAPRRAWHLLGTSLVSHAARCSARGGAARAALALSAARRAATFSGPTIHPLLPPLHDSVCRVYVGGHTRACGALSRGVRAGLTIIKPLHLTITRTHSEEHERARGFRYDWVVRARPDLGWTLPVAPAASFLATARHASRFFRADDASASSPPVR